MQGKTKMLTIYVEDNVVVVALNMIKMPARDANILRFDKRSLRQGKPKSAGGQPGQGTKNTLGLG